MRVNTIHHINGIISTEWKKCSILFYLMPFIFVASVRLYLIRIIHIWTVIYSHLFAICVRCKRDAALSPEYTILALVNWNCSSIYAFVCSVFMVRCKMRHFLKPQDTTISRTHKFVLLENDLHHFAIWFSWKLKLSHVEYLHGICMMSTENQ